MVKTVFFDGDGVLYRGDQVNEAAKRIIEVLREKNVPCVLITNNSTKTRQTYVKKLQKLGIKIQEEFIFTSAYMTATVIAQEKQQAKVFVVGEQGLKEELRAQGHTILKGESELADYVVAGLDRTFTYQKLSVAQYHIQHGARFYATNTDATLPGRGRQFPGAGTMIAAIQTATATPPEKVIGKPSHYMFTQALNKIGVKPSQAVMIGDRLETDIQGALNAGINAGIALTGVSTLTKAQEFVKKRSEGENKPWVRILDDFSKILEWIDE